MYSANLCINNSSYTNDDAISNAINYITRLNDNNIFFYGNWPPNSQSAVELYEELRLRYPDQTCPQQIQHFWISFGNLSDVHFINEYAESLAFLFATAFPICFATHEEKNKHLHTHFVVSTTSFIPNHPPLVKNVWRTYLDNMKQYSKAYHKIFLTEFHKIPSDTWQRK